MDSIKIQGENEIWFDGDVMNIRAEKVAIQIKDGRKERFIPLWKLIDSYLTLREMDRADKELWRIESGGEPWIEYDFGVDTGSGHISEIELDQNGRVISYIRKE